MVNCPPLKASDLGSQGNIDPYHWLTIDSQIYHRPWWEPSSKTMRLVSTARDLEYKRLRASWLSEGFNHWRKLVSLGYPRRRAPRFINSLKDVAKEVRLLRDCKKAVLAAKSDWFAARYYAAGDVKDDTLVQKRADYGDFKLLGRHNLEEVSNYIRLVLGKDGLIEGVFRLRDLPVQMFLDDIVQHA